MSIFQIFNTKEEAEFINAAIDALLDYPNGAETYRKIYEHPDENDLRVACVVTDKLIDACAAMSEAERLNYYDADSLVTLQTIHSQGWFNTQ